MGQNGSAPKKRKIMVPQVVNGQEKMVEIEVDDTGGPTWGPKADHTLLDHDLRRLDGPAKASGAAKYTYDVRPPGMLHGAILPSPFASAQVVSIDTGPARQMPGVRAVLDFGQKTLRYEGDPVAAVAADMPEQAEDALSAIKVSYKPLPFVVTPDQAMKPGAPQADAQGNVQVNTTEGDRQAAEDALKRADAVVERDFTITMQHHVCLETHGVTVDYRGGNTAVVYASTQGTFTIPGDAAQALGLNEPDVTSVVEYMGGGFGSKFGLDLPGSIACQLSKQVNRPVKLMLTRPEEFLMAGNRPGAIQKVRAGASRDGKLVALIAEQYEDCGLGQGGLAGLPYIYQCGAAHHTHAAVFSNKDASRAMRAPGHPQASFAMESIMDDLAAAVGMDPIELRKRNTGDPAYHRQLDTGAKAIGWSQRPAKPGAGQAYGPDGALRQGYGCALATWGGGGHPECQVDVFIKPDGAVTVQVGTQDLGTGTRTYTAAVVAEELGLPMSAVEARIGRSSYGQANASGGSTTVASLSPALKDAAYNARLELFGKVAPVMGARPQDLQARGGRIASSNGKSLTWKQACALLGPTGISARGTWQAQLQSSGVHGAAFARVEVDIGTGRVRVLKMVGVQDCGLPLNRLAVESQINGGMILGIGYALLEQHWVDTTTGHMLNPTMEDYKVAGALEMPEMVPIIDDGDDRTAPIGMAEPAAIPGASAIANAVFNACGARITSLPITPDKLLMALQGERKS